MFLVAYVLHTNPALLREHGTHAKPRVCFEQQNYK